MSRHIYKKAVLTVVPAKLCFGAGGLGLFSMVALLIAKKPNS